MDTLVSMLKQVFQPLFQSVIYEKFVVKMAYLNVAAIVPQTWAAWTAPSTAGISAGMWAVFAFIQIVFLLEAIKNDSRSMAGSMLLSIPQSLAIIAAVSIRG